MSVARRVIIPSQGIFRTVFLYVGQGESTIMAIPNGDSHKIVLIDCHSNEQEGCIQIPKMLKDLTDTVDIFINTHPHNDHLKGIKSIAGTVNISEIWHSGHIPGKDHKEAYDELKDIIDDLPEDKVTEMLGTRTKQKIGDVTYNILAPAEHVADEIADETPETRYQRIHEQCSVIRFLYGSPDAQAILITGDSDLAAWQNHITDYHENRLPSVVLSASHHGSRTFFKDKEDDEPYTEHMDKIGCQYVIISAPKRDESPFGHPHEDAIDIYKDYLEEENILHLGANRECVVVDISSDGEVEVYIDKDLVDEYGWTDDDDEGNKKFTKGMVLTTLDHKPMGE